MRVVFFGSGAYVIPVIEYLRKFQDLVLVVTTQRDPTDSIPTYCNLNAIQYISVSTLKKENIHKILRAINAPVGVLANFGLIIPQSIIDIFPKGIINIHPSLLPKYRGPTPGQTAIINGEEKSGVSIMLLDKEVDHGPLLGYKEEILNKNDTALSFYERSFKHGATMLQHILAPYINGELAPQHQDHNKATWTTMLTKERGFIDDPNPPDTTTIDRMIRAYHPWPGVWTKCSIEPLKGKIIKFLPGDSTNQYKVQVEGKKVIGIKDFLNGYPMLKDWIKKFIPLED